MPVPPHGPGKASAKTNRQNRSPVGYEGLSASGEPVLGWQMGTARRRVFLNSATVSVQIRGDSSNSYIFRPGGGRKGVPRCNFRRTELTTSRGRTRSESDAMSEKATPEFRTARRTYPRLGAVGTARIPLLRPVRALSARPCTPRFRLRRARAIPSCNTAC